MPEIGMYVDVSWRQTRMHHAKTEFMGINLKRIGWVLSRRESIPCDLFYQETSYEPTHEILALFVLRKFILQIRMRSHSDVWFFVRSFVYFYSSCVRSAKALARLRGCAGSPEPSLVAYAMSTVISWAGSYIVTKTNDRKLSNLLFRK